MSEPQQSEISILFASDPLKLTKPDRKPMIEYYRDNRLKYLSGVKAEKAVKAPAQKSKGPLPDLDLDVLDL